MASSPSLLRACGTIGLACALAPIFTDVISWFLAEDYSPIANSISKLAVGPSSWLMDVGLWLFVLSCLAVAIGLWGLGVRAKYWTAALVSLVLVAICVGIVARVNQYAGTQNPGANVHIWAVVGVGIFFLLTTWLAVPGLRTISDGLARFSLLLGVAWIVLAPVYWFFVPDGWSGAVERLLALMMIVWLATMSRRLRRTAEHGAPGLHGRAASGHRG